MPALLISTVMGPSAASAAIAGFNTGLWRSAITILAYLFATPAAVWVMSVAALVIGGNATSPLAQSWVLFFGAFLAIGMIFGKLARMALDETIGAEAGIGDRLGGAALGAVRVGLIAITLVLVFDRLVPTDRQPAVLQGPPLRPPPSAARQQGVTSPPPEGA